MKIENMSLDNEKLILNSRNTSKDSKRQKQLIARKRIEDYIAEKQLRKNINDLDYGF